MSTEASNDVVIEAEIAKLAVELVRRLAESGFQTDWIAVLVLAKRWCAKSPRLKENGIGWIIGSALEDWECFEGFKSQLALDAAKESERT